MAASSRTTFRGALLMVALALATAACGGGSESVSSTPSTESSQAEFLNVTLATSDGGQLEFGTLEGQDVVLWFWAPW